MSDWKEFERLKELPNLKDLLLVNTPLYNSHVDEKTEDDAEWRMEVLKRLPGLQKLDGKDVTDDELEAPRAEELGCVVIIICTRCAVYFSPRLLPGLSASVSTQVQSALSRSRRPRRLPPRRGRR